MSESDIQRYEQMLAEDPESRAFAPLAEAYRKAGRLDDAIRTARTGLEIHVGYSGGLVVLGRALHEKGELDNAAEVLQKAVSETPENYLAQKFLGKVLLEKGETQGALKALEAANFLSPDDEDVAVLLEETKKKAYPPETMEYKEQSGQGEEEEPKIVTYEQKPVTVDGVELVPLPTRRQDETFSFSAEEAEARATGDLTEPDNGIPEIPLEEIPEEEAAPPVGETDRESGAAGAAAVSMEEFGPDVAEFIREGEGVEEPFLPDREEEVPVEDLPVTPSELIQEIEAEPELVIPDRAPDAVPVSPDAVGAPEQAPRSGARLPEEAKPAPPAPPGPEAAPGPEVPPEPPAPPPEPAKASRPAPQPETDQAQQPAAEPVEISAFSLDASASGGNISTETLADLYAKQGLTDKAVQIYRQILAERPGDETIMLKLSALEAPGTTGAAQAGEVKDTPPAAVEEGSTDDPAETLQKWLDNVERIRRP